MVEGGGEWEGTDCARALPPFPVFVCFTFLFKGFRFGFFGLTSVFFDPSRKKVPVDKEDQT